MTPRPGTHWYLIDGINPEPWTASEGSIGRKNGKLYVQYHKQEGLRMYQAALQEAFERDYPHVRPIGGNNVRIELQFYFWRQLVNYESDSGKSVQRHQADVTNLQKATEDALQGILYVNDRDVQRVTSMIMEQMPRTQPAILICVAPTVPPYHDIDIKARKIREAKQLTAQPDNTPEWMGIEHDPADLF